MAEIPPASKTLSEKKIPHRLFYHQGKIESLEQAARERDQKPEQVVRSIVFRLAKDEYLMVLVPGPRQISWPALRRHVGLSRLTMASEREVLDATGYLPGAVAPFGLPKTMRTLVDRSLLEQEEISLGSGVRGVAVIMLTQNLLEALEVFELGSFIED